MKTIHFFCQYCLYSKLLSKGPKPGRKKNNHENLSKMGCFLQHHYFFYLHIPKYNVWNHFSHSLVAFSPRFILSPKLAIYTTVSWALQQTGPLRVKVRSEIKRVVKATPLLRSNQSEQSLIGPGPLRVEDPQELSPSSRVLINQNLRQLRPHSSQTLMILE